MAAQFMMDDWTLAPGRENDIVVKLDRYNSCGSGSVSGGNRLLYSAVPLIVGKPVQAVVLPTGGTVLRVGALVIPAVVGIHVFAVGIDNP